MASPPTRRRPAKRLKPQLLEPGWLPEVRDRLEKLMRAGAGQNRPVVFDFDNTIVCGDIGEATLALLVRDGVLERDAIPATLAPPFRVAGKLVSLSSVADLTEYYEAFLAPTAHGRHDPAPLGNGYVWAVEIMQGLTVSEVVQATRQVYALSKPMQDRWLEATPGRPSYPVPSLYPEMVEFIAELLRARFDVWIVSASNVWSVRWMIAHALNPALRERGLPHGISAEKVIGLSTLLTDREGRLYKDALLVRENPAYAALEGEILADLRLTSRLQFPVPTYSGKIACAWDALRCRPHLAAGDSPGDHPLLAFAENRLWIARLEKPDYLRSTLALARQCGPANWVIQPTLCRETPGFVSTLAGLAQRLSCPASEVRASAALLSTALSEGSVVQAKEGG